MRKIEANEPVKFEPKIKGTSVLASRRASASATQPVRASTPSAADRVSAPDDLLDISLPSSLLQTLPLDLSILQNLTPELSSNGTDATEKALEQHRMQAKLSYIRSLKQNVQNAAPMMASSIPKTRNQVQNFSLLSRALPQPKPEVIQSLSKSMVELPESRAMETYPYSPSPFSSMDLSMQQSTASFYEGTRPSSQARARTISFSPYPDCDYLDAPIVPTDILSSQVFTALSSPPRSLVVSPSPPSRVRLSRASDISRLQSRSRSVGSSATCPLLLPQPSELVNPLGLQSANGDPMPNSKAALFKALRELQEERRQILVESLKKVRMEERIVARDKHHQDLEAKKRAKLYEEELAKLLERRVIAVQACWRGWRWRVFYRKYRRIKRRAGRLFSVFWSPQKLAFEKWRKELIARRHYKKKLSRLLLTVLMTNRFNALRHRSNFRLTFGALLVKYRLPIYLTVWRAYTRTMRALRKDRYPPRFALGSAQALSQDPKRHGPVVRVYAPYISNMSCDLETLSNAWQRSYRLKHLAQERGVMINLKQRFKAWKSFARFQITKREKDERARRHNRWRLLTFGLRPFRKLLDWRRVRDTRFRIKFRASFLAWHDYAKNRRKEKTRITAMKDKRFNTLVAISWKQWVKKFEWRSGLHHQASIKMVENKPKGLYVLFTWLNDPIQLALLSCFKAWRLWAKESAINRRVDSELEKYKEKLWHEKGLHKIANKDQFFANVKVMNVVAGQIEKLRMKAMQQKAEKKENPKMTEKQLESVLQENVAEMAAKLERDRKLALKYEMKTTAQRLNKIHPGFTLGSPTSTPRRTFYFDSVPYNLSLQEKKEQEEKERIQQILDLRISLKIFKQKDSESAEENMETQYDSYFNQKARMVAQFPIKPIVTQTDLAILNPTLSPQEDENSSSQEDSCNEDFQLFENSHENLQREEEEEVEREGASPMIVIDGEPEMGIEEGPNQQDDQQLLSPIRSNQMSPSPAPSISFNSEDFDGSARISSVEEENPENGKVEMSPNEPPPIQSNEKKVGSPKKRNVTPTKTGKSKTPIPAKSKSPTRKKKGEETEQSQTVSAEIEIENENENGEILETGQKGMTPFAQKFAHKKMKPPRAPPTSKQPPKTKDAESTQPQEFVENENENENSVESKSVEEGEGEGLTDRVHSWVECVQEPMEPIEDQLITDAEVEGERSPDQLQLPEEPETSTTTTTTTNNEKPTKPKSSGGRQTPQPKKTISNNNKTPQKAQQTKGKISSSAKVEGEGTLAPPPTAAAAKKPASKANQVATRTPNKKDNVGEGERSTPTPTGKLGRSISRSGQKGTPEIQEGGEERVLQSRGIKGFKPGQRTPPIVLIRAATPSTQRTLEQGQSSPIMEWEHDTASSAGSSRRSWAAKIARKQVQRALGSRATSRGLTSSGGGSDMEGKPQTPGFDSGQGEFEEINVVAGDGEEFDFDDGEKIFENENENENARPTAFPRSPNGSILNLDSVEDENQCGSPVFSFDQDEGEETFRTEEPQQQEMLQVTSDIADIAFPMEALQEQADPNPDQELDLELSLDGVENLAETQPEAELSDGNINNMNRHQSFRSLAGWTDAGGGGGASEPQTGSIENVEQSENVGSNDKTTNIPSRTASRARARTEKFAERQKRLAEEKRMKRPEGPYSHLLGDGRHIVIRLRNLKLMDQWVDLNKPKVENQVSGSGSGSQPSQPPDDAISTASPQKEFQPSSPAQFSMADGERFTETPIPPASPIPETFSNSPIQSLSQNENQNQSEDPNVQEIVISMQDTSFDFENDLDAELGQLTASGSGSDQLINPPGIGGDSFRSAASAAPIDPEFSPTSSIGTATIGEIVSPTNRRSESPPSTPPPQNEKLERKTSFASPILSVEITTKDGEPVLPTPQSQQAKSPSPIREQSSPPRQQEQTTRHPFEGRKVRVTGGGNVGRFGFIKHQIGPELFIVKLNKHSTPDWVRNPPPQVDFTKRVFEMHAHALQRFWDRVEQDRERFKNWQERQSMLKAAMDQTWKEEVSIGFSRPGTVSSPFPSLRPRSQAQPLCGVGRLTGGPNIFPAFPSSQQENSTQDTFDIETSARRAHDHMLEVMMKFGEKLVQDVGGEIECAREEVMLLIEALEQRAQGTSDESRSESPDQWQTLNESSLEEYQTNPVNPQQQQQEFTGFSEYQDSPSAEESTQQESEKQIQDMISKQQKLSPRSRRIVNRALANAKGRNPFAPPAFQIDAKRNLKVRGPRPETVEQYLRALDRFFDDGPLSHFVSWPGLTNAPERILTSPVPGVLPITRTTTSRSSSSLRNQNPKILVNDSLSLEHEISREVENGGDEEEGPEILLPFFHVWSDYVLRIFDDTPPHVDDTVLCPGMHELICKIDILETVRNKYAEELAEWAEREGFDPEGASKPNITPSLLSSPLSRRSASRLSHPPKRIRICPNPKNLPFYSIENEIEKIFFSELANHNKSEPNFLIGVIPQEVRVDIIRFHESNNTAAKDMVNSREDLVISFAESIFGNPDKDSIFFSHEAVNHMNLLLEKMGDMISVHSKRWIPTEKGTFAPARPEKAISNTGTTSATTTTQSILGGQSPLVHFVSPANLSRSTSPKSRPVSTKPPAASAARPTPLIDTDLSSSFAFSPTRVHVVSSSMKLAPNIASHFDKTAKLLVSNPVETSAQFTPQAKLSKLGQKFRREMTRSQIMMNSNEFDFEESGSGDVTADENSFDQPAERLPRVGGVRTPSPAGFIPPPSPQPKLLGSSSGILPPMSPARTSVVFGGGTSTGPTPSLPLPPRPSTSLGLSSAKPATPTQIDSRTVKRSFEHLDPSEFEAARTHHPPSSSQKPKTKPIAGNPPRSSSSLARIS